MRAVDQTQRHEHGKEAHYHLAVPSPEPLIEGRMQLVEQEVFFWARKTVTQSN